MKIWYNIEKDKIYFDENKSKSILLFVIDKNMENNVKEYIFSKRFYLRDIINKYFNDNKDIGIYKIRRLFSDCVIKLYRQRR